jgi:hypothetical protein
MTFLLPSDATMYMLNQPTPSRGKQARPSCSETVATTPLSRTTIVLGALLALSLLALVSAWACMMNAGPLMWIVNGLLAILVVVAMGFVIAHNQRLTRRLGAEQHLAMVLAESARHRVFDPRVALSSWTEQD